MDEDLVLCLFLFALCATGGAAILFAKHVRVQRMKASLGLLLLGNVLVLLFLVTILAVGGEIYFRFFYDATDAINLTKVSERWFQRHCRLNGSGCRDTIEYETRIATGKRRITFLGDSYTAGHG